MTTTIKKISNWSEYNNSLIRRGRFSIWVTKEIMENWRAVEDNSNRGRPKIYSDAVVMLMMTLSEVYSLPYRQTQGLLEELLEKSEYGGKLSVPEYPIMSKRGGDMKEQAYRNGEKAKAIMQKGGGVHIAIDSTGIKIYGENEWKVKTHGQGKRRKWVKLHAVIDIESRQVLASSVSSNDVHDGEEVLKLVDQIRRSGIGVSELYGDGAYHWNEILDELEYRQIKAYIPLPKNATLSAKDDEAHMLSKARDKLLIEQYDAGGVDSWKKSSGYHKRSLIENLFSRLKIIFGERMRCKNPEIRRIRMNLKLHILNVFSSLGLPQYT